MATVCGVVWGVISVFVPFFYLNLLLAPGAGYAIGEVVSLSVNRKRGRGLATIAGIALVVSYLISIFLPSLLLVGLLFANFHFIDLLALALGIFFAVNRLR